MTFSRSHGKRRLEAARIRDVSAPKAAANGTARTDAAGDGAFRRPLLHLTAALRARVEQGVASALAGAASPQEGAQLARVALSLYYAGRRELDTRSPLALSHLVRWAIATATAQHLALAAHAAGPATDRGRQLLELSMRLEGRAERASVAALTMARALARTGAPAAGDAPWLVSTAADDGGSETP